jgi:hypothetical protein
MRTGLRFEGGGDYGWGWGVGVGVRVEFHGGCSVWCYVVGRIDENMVLKTLIAGSYGKLIDSEKDVWLVSEIGLGGLRMEVERQRLDEDV